MRVIRRYDFYEKIEEAQKRITEKCNITKSIGGYKLTEYADMPAVPYPSARPENVYLSDSDTITLMHDCNAFHSKPKSDDMRGITYRMTHNACTHNLTTEQLKDIINGGYTMVFGIRGREENLKESNIRGQQLFAIDIDNDTHLYGKQDNKLITLEKFAREDYMSIDDVWDRCDLYGLNPLCIYETFSSSEQWPRYRVIFATPEIVPPEQAQKIRLALLRLFPEADEACKDGMRRYYAGKVVYCGTYTNQADYLLSFYQAEEKPHKLPDGVSISENDGKKSVFVDFTKVSMQRTYTGGYDLRQEIQKFDITAYFKANYGISERIKNKDRILYDVCPLCGHRDDFYIYPHSQTWACFSKSNDTGDTTGGNIITFLMMKKGLNKQAAVNMFLYDIRGLQPINFNN